MRNTSWVAAASGRDRLFISACLVLLTALAWAYLVHLHRQMSSAVSYSEMMAEMGMATDRPWTGVDLFFAFIMWAVMMVGMMAPSAAPVLFLFASARARRGERGVRVAVLSFGFGYLMVWAGFSACATLGQWALHERAMLSPAMAASTPKVAGAILMAAGAYQLTPWKGACLTHCRSPLGFFMTNWREGPLGALQMGIRHGAYCLGCCWALMCVLFAVGVMNLVWIAVFTGVVLLEKIGPAGTIFARVVGGAMVIVGMFWTAGNVRLIEIWIRQ